MKMYNLVADLGDYVSAQEDFKRGILCQAKIEGISLVTPLMPIKAGTSGMIVYKSEDTLGVVFEKSEHMLLFGVNDLDLIIPQ